MLSKIKLNIFYPNYFSFVVTGAMALLVGSILPHLIEEGGLNFAIGGTCLSVFAIGNFVASFVNPFLSKMLNRKASIVLTACLQPVTLLAISKVPPVPVLLVCFFFLGISRGCYSIINNAYLNEKGDGSAFSLNFLHACFSFGAFLAPSLFSVFFGFGLGWRFIVYTIAALGVLSILAVTRLDLRQSPVKKNVPADLGKSVENKKFYKQPVFWITGFILFFYLGFENCVNGWFVTYFKNSGIMSQTFANELVSFSWGAILIGRITTALVSTKVSPRLLMLIDCIAASACFAFMISTDNLVVVTVSIIALGFFLAGIYPTGVSVAGAVFKGSDFGMSMFLALCAFGGIIAPQVIGIVADKIGLVGAIAILLVNAAFMIALSVVNLRGGKVNQKSA